MAAPDLSGQDAFAGAVADIGIEQERRGSLQADDLDDARQRDDQLAQPVDLFVGETARLPGGPARGMRLAGDEHQRQREVVRDAFRTQIADDGETLARRIVGAKPDLDALLEHDGKWAVAEFRRILKAEVDRSDLDLRAGFPDEAAAE